MFCQGGPCWQIHMLSELFVSHGPQSFEGLVQAASGEGSPATPSPLLSVTPQTGGSQVRSQGLSDCPAVPAFARVIPRGALESGPRGHPSLARMAPSSLGEPLPLLHRAAPREQARGSFQSGAKGRAPLPPHPGESWGFGGPEAVAAAASHVELHLRQNELTWEEPDWQLEQGLEGPGHRRDLPDPHPSRGLPWGPHILALLHLAWAGILSLVTPGPVNPQRDTCAASEAPADAAVMAAAAAQPVPRQIAPVQPFRECPSTPKLSAQECQSDQGSR